MQADLTKAACSFSSTVDGVILIVGLQLIFDVRAALRTLERILKPVPCISQVSVYDMDIRRRFAQHVLVDQEAV